MNGSKAATTAAANRGCRYSSRYGCAGVIKSTGCRHLRHHECIWPRFKWLHKSHQSRRPRPFWQPCGNGDDWQNINPGVTGGVSVIANGIYGAADITSASIARADTHTAAAKTLGVALGIDIASLHKNFTDNGRVGYVKGRYGLKLHAIGAYRVVPASPRKRTLHPTSFPSRPRHLVSVPRLFMNSRNTDTMYALH